jgi:hypothetical protein
MTKNLTCVGAAEARQGARRAAHQQRSAHVAQARPQVLSQQHVAAGQDKNIRVIFAELAR